MYPLIILVVCVVILIWSLVQQLNADKRLVGENDPIRLEPKLAGGAAALVAMVTIAITIIKT